LDKGGKSFALRYVSLTVSGRMFDKFCILRGCNESNKRVKIPPFLLVSLSFISPPAVNSMKYNLRDENCGSMKVRLSQMYRSGPGKVVNR
jgi:hypothetical protein